MQKIKPLICRQIKINNILYQITSMWCNECTKYKYHYYLETRENFVDSLYIYQRTKCVKCDTLNWVKSITHMKKKKIN